MRYLGGLPWGMRQLAIVDEQSTAGADDTQRIPSLTEGPATPVLSQQNRQRSGGDGGTAATRSSAGTSTSATIDVPAAQKLRGRQVYLAIADYFDGVWALGKPISFRGDDEDDTCRKGDRSLSPSSSKFVKSSTVSSSTSNSSTITHKDTINMCGAAGAGGGEESKNDDDLAGSIQMRDSDSSKEQQNAPSRQQNRSKSDASENSAEVTFDGSSSATDDRVDRKIARQEMFIGRKVNQRKMDELPYALVRAKVGIFFFF